MDKRFFLFLTLSLTVLFGFQAVMTTLYPPKEKPAAKKIAKKDDAAARLKDNGQPKDKAEDKAGDKAGRQDESPQETGNGDEEPPAGPPDGDDAQPPPAEASDAELRHLVMGSLDPKSRVRMLVYLTSRGAAVERVFLNTRLDSDERVFRYEDIEDSSGFLGPLPASDEAGGGCRVGVVGPGTPADLAGLQADDVITAIDGKTVKSAAQFGARLAGLRPNTQIKLSVLRDGKPVGPLTAMLTRRPLQIIRPELGTRPLDVFVPGRHDQMSFLLTFERIGDERLLPNENELPGLGLRDDNWTVTRRTALEVEFSQVLSDRGLKVVKRYRLAESPESEISNPDYPAYNLALDIEIQNTGSSPQEIAYRLDGPTGLPTEGWWYSNKIGRNWFGRRLRDVVMHTELDGPVLIDNSTILSEHEEGRKRRPLQKQAGQNNPLAYLGTETQYFAAVMLPDRTQADAQLFSSVEALVVGDLPQDKAKRQLTNITCRLISAPAVVEPGAAGALRQSFVVFVGPKRRDLLEQYGPNKFPTAVNLGELIYYGWAIWGFFAEYLSGALHIFYRWTGNYGIAIIMLTVVVRLCMFPLSLKQAQNAQKMQELQPEIKKISEKYKNDLEKRTKAIQDVYKKNNYNPLSGCLPLFIQLPIFIGLYRALMTDIELRQAPLISRSIPWADNLAAPDMLWRWEGLLPFLITETGFLGPYLNVLPLITVVLFIWQQKMFMPPPTDEQAALQQKMMQYMMIFFGLLFFRVPSGLCLYFIVSSLWGLGERKLLPKTAAQQAKASAPSKAEPQKAAKAKPLAKASAGGGGKRRKK